MAVLLPDLVKVQRVPPPGAFQISSAVNHTPRFRIGRCVYSPGGITGYPSVLQWTQVPCLQAPAFCPELANQPHRSQPFRRETS
jgi:hypothetical protein